MLVKRKLKYFFGLGFLILPKIVSAQGPLEDLRQAAGLTNASLPVLIGRFIQILLGLSGLILLGFFIYAGILWMTSGGNEEKIAKAKKIISSAVIGLIIVVISFAAATFITSILDRILGRETPPAIAPPFIEGPPGGHFLGGGIIDSHYPQRDASSIPRNTTIIVKFKQEIALDSIMANKLPSKNGVVWGKINPKSVKIEFKDGGSFKVVPLEKVLISTSDERQFVIDPIGLLPGNTVNKVTLSNLEKKSGGLAFSSQNPTYSWSFTTSNQIDDTPPKVESVIPKESTVSPNTVVQVNFNEPINPISATKNNVAVAEKDTDIPGEITLSNGFKTLEFLPTALCKDASGKELKNSCGLVPRCFSPNTNIDVGVIAANLVENVSGLPPELVSLDDPKLKEEKNNNLAVFPYSGIVDAAGNSLDGNNSGDSQGPPTDNYVFSFRTNDIRDLDLTPPVLLELSPTSKKSVNRKTEVRAKFSESIRSSTLNTDSFTINPVPVAGYTVELENNIGKLKTSNPWLNPKTTYSPNINSQVQDLAQNCFTPCECRGESCECENPERTKILCIGEGSNRVCKQP